MIKVTDTEKHHSNTQAYENRRTILYRIARLNFYTQNITYEICYSSSPSSRLTLDTDMVLSFSAPFSTPMIKQA